MLHITDRAKEALLAKKQSANLAHVDVTLRLAPLSGGRLGLVADRPRTGDQVVMHGDATVLLIDADLSSSVLAGRTVDCRTSAGGRLEVVITSSSV